MKVKNPVGVNQFWVESPELLKITLNLLRDMQYIHMRYRQGNGLNN